MTSRLALAVPAAFALVAATATVPAPANAAVTITPERIVVTGEGARAVVRRAPFRLAVEDDRGRTVLEQVANTRPAPQPVPPTADPEPLGTDNQRRPTVYAPLTFTVGADRSVQYPSTQYVGNQLLGAQAGVQYAAVDVVGAKQAGTGVELTVSTNDPSGRQLKVVIRPERAGTIRVVATPTPDDGVAVMHDSFASGGDEGFHGFGGRHNAVDQRGQEFFTWLEEENFGCGVTQPIACDRLPGGQGEKYQFPGGPHGAYYGQALFVSSRPYGFLLDRTEMSHFRMASDRDDAWQVGVAGKAIDYVVAPGEPKEAVGKVTALTGRHRLAPRWALGSMTSRFISPNSNAARYEQQVREDLRQIDRTDVPIQSYDLFGWELLPRETTKQLIGEFRRRGIRVLAYFKCFVSKDTVGYDNPRAFDEAIEKGLVATTPAGQPFYFTPPFVGAGVAALLDFTNPETVRWWKGRIREALDMGFDGWMQDFGEQVQVDMRFRDGSTGQEMHNRYPLAYHRATREVFDEYRRKGREPWMYTRSGYSGTPGSQSDEGGNFPGDNETAFARSNGLASMTPDMLSRAVGGAYGFSTDIGGYGDYVTPPTTKELLVRWAQAAALSPFFRLHNSANTETRQPWFFDRETERQYGDAARLHLAAIPLIERLWREAERTGVPPTRPMWLEFPGDRTAAAQEQQWMLGPDVLVAPVVTEGATARTVYFPAGEWVHPETGERFRGPQERRFEAPLSRLPYFFRAGTRPFEADGGQRLGLPAARSCVSRRAFRIRLRPRGLRSARVYVGAKRVAVVRGSRLRAPIDLRGLPAGTVRVRVRGVTRSGRRVRETRTYRTCAARRGARVR